MELLCELSNVVQTTSACKYSMPHTPRLLSFGYIIFVLHVIAPRLAEPRHFKIGVILPSNQQYLFSITKVRPALDIALETVLESPAFNFKGHNLSILFQDSKCSEAYGINQAFNIYTHEKVAMFLGPVCDFALAPIARQMRFWNLPLVSCAAANSFSDLKSKEYTLLTNVGPNPLVKVTDMLISLLEAHNLHNFKVLYYRLGQNNHLPKFCHFAASALHYHTMATRRDTFKQYIYKMDEKSDLSAVLRQQVGLEHTGEYSRVTHVSVLDVDVGVD